MPYLIGHTYWAASFCVLGERGFSVRGPGGDVLACGLYRLYLADMYLLDALRGLGGLLLYRGNMTKYRYARK